MRPPCLGHDVVRVDRPIPFTCHDWVPRGDLWFASDHKGGAGLLGSLCSRHNCQRQYQCPRRERSSLLVPGSRNAKHTGRLIVSACPFEGTSPCEGIAPRAPHARTTVDCKTSCPAIPPDLVGCATCDALPASRADDAVGGGDRDRKSVV